MTIVFTSSPVYVFPERVTGVTNVSLVSVAFPLDAGLFDLPYIIVDIPEIRGGSGGMMSDIPFAENALGVIHLPDISSVTRKYITATPEYVCKEFSSSITLSRLTFRFMDPEGSVLQFSENPCVTVHIQTAGQSSDGVIHIGN